MADNEKTDIEKLQDGLDYLSQTKDLIKQAIVSKGQTIGNDTTFREYAQKISDIETGVDTSDATATAQDICGNKTAYARGQKLTGQIPMYDPNVGPYTTNQNTLVDSPSGGTPSIFVENNQNYKVAFANGAGFEVSYSTLASFIGLAAGKIKSGETILGVTGNYTGIDTSDATATAGDIIKDKTAYVNGQNSILDPFWNSDLEHFKIINLHCLNCSMICHSIHRTLNSDDSLGEWRAQWILGHTEWSLLATSHPPFLFTYHLQMFVQAFFSGLNQVPPKFTC